MNKRIFEILLVACVLLSCVTSVFANDNEEILEKQPRWSYVISTYGELTISSSGKAAIYAEGSVNSSNTDSISLSATLQRKENGTWKDVTSWSSTGSDRATVSKTYYVTAGYTYRISGTVKAYVNGKVVESVDYTSYTATY